MSHSLRWIDEKTLIPDLLTRAPQVRPGLRSRPPAEIIDEVRRLVARGYREIVLTGIHLGHFGVETTRGRSGMRPYRLWHLIRELDEIEGNWRLRLSSLEAAEVGPDFLAAIAECGRRNGLAR